MNLRCSFKNMDTSPALRLFTQEKCETLQRYFGGRISLTWTFTRDTKKDLKIAHCHLVGNNMDYFGHADGDEFHKVIEAVIEKIERQVRKHKEVVKDHLHRNGHRLPAAS